MSTCSMQQLAWSVMRVVNLPNSMNKKEASYLERMWGSGVLKWGGL
jgi:hypothetical protein